MNSNAFEILFERDLLKLKDELSGFKNEQNLWKTAGGIANSSGNLAMHLIGNLNHFIGATLGNTGYIRNREFEFIGKNVPRAEILENINQTIVMLKSVFPKLNEAELEKEFPLDFAGTHPTGHYLLHFYGHFTYHLGQINYLRRVLEG
jgi:uncharacterized damage-inducible protein DinB